MSGLAGRDQRLAQLGTDHFGLLTPHMAEAIGSDVLRHIGQHMLPQSTIDTWSVYLELSDEPVKGDRRVG